MPKLTLENKGVRIAVRPRTYGQRLDSYALSRKFLKDISNTPTRDELDVRNARSNFIHAMSFADVEAGNLIAPHIGMTDEEFDAAFQLFAALDEYVIDWWLEATERLRKGLDPTTAPPETLTDEERHDPE